MAKGERVPAAGVSHALIPGADAEDVLCHADGALTAGAGEGGLFESFLEALSVLSRVVRTVRERCRAAIVRVPQMKVHLALPLIHMLLPVLDVLELLLDTPLSPQEFR